MKHTQRGFAIGIVVAIIAILALGGGAVYVASKAQKTAQVESNATSTVEANLTADVNVNQNMSIKGLLGLGKTLKCTFSDATSTAATEGTVYIANGKFRGDFSSKASGGAAVKSYMISDGQDAYVWSDAMKQGFKMKMTADAKTSTNTNTQAPDINKEMKYNCMPWTVNEAVFSAPANVTFIDAASIGAGVSAGASGKIPAGLNASTSAEIKALMGR